MIQIASIKSQPQDTDLRIWLSAQAPPGSSPDIQLGQFSPSHRLRGEWQRGESSYSEFSDQYAHELSQSWDELMLEEISAQASGRDVVVLYDEVAVTRAVASAFADFLRELELIVAGAPGGCCRK